MRKPDGYDNAEAKIQGEFETMQPGAYVTKIVKAEVTTSKSGKEMLVLSLDVCEGEHADFYANFSARIGKDVYLNVYQITGGESLSFFKGLIDTIEVSNPPYKFNFDERTLIGKRLGVNLREEEYQSGDEVKTSLRVAYCVTVAEARAGLPVLKKKTLNGAKTSSSPRPSMQQSAPPPGDEDLPF